MCTISLRHVGPVLEVLAVGLRRSAEAETDGSDERRRPLRSCSSNIAACRERSHSGARSTLFEWVQQGASVDSGVRGGSKGADGVALGCCD